MDSTVWQDADVSRRYLEGVRGAIPLAAEQVGIMLRLVRAARTPRRILDLGCGDGFLAAPLLADWPGCTATLVDFSDTMLEAARLRFAAEPSRVRIVRLDYGRPGWPDSLRDAVPFDAIVSGFSIHHQPDIRKRSLYREVFDMLAPGGVFVNVEHVSSPSPWVRERAEDHLIDALFAYHRTASSKSRDEAASEFVRRKDKEANILAPVEEQCEWLRAIGFEDVDCYLKVFELAVFGGRKPEAPPRP